MDRERVPSLRLWQPNEAGYIHSHQDTTVAPDRKATHRCRPWTEWISTRKLTRSSTANKPARPNLVAGTLADLSRVRAELLAENAPLRQQLIVLRRRTKTPRLTWRERLSLLVLARWVPNWKQVLQMI
jgi:hypothetical protein